MARIKRGNGYTAASFIIGETEDSIPDNKRGFKAYNRHDNFYTIYIYNTHGVKYDKVEFASEEAIIKYICIFSLRE